MELLSQSAPLKPSEGLTGKNGMCLWEAARYSDKKNPLQITGLTNQVKKTLSNFSLLGR